MSVSASSAVPTNGTSLSDILDGNHEDQFNEDSIPEAVEEDEAIDVPPKHGFCVECEDQPAEIRCNTCEDDYCEVCYTSQHRKGNRKRHANTPLGPVSVKKQKVVKAAARDNGVAEDVEDAKSESSSELDEDELMESIDESRPPKVSLPPKSVLERAKFIPMRLTLGERKYLRLLEAALSVSEYTDKVDIFGFGLSKTKRIVHQIRELCAILSGLLISADYQEGQKLVSDRNFEANAEFFGKIFELGRRHKIMNPDKMRTTYGKLIYLLQDSQNPEVSDMLGFSCVIPLVTVYGVLEAHDSLALLEDDLIATATQEIIAEGRRRREIQIDIKKKEKAIEILASRYARRDGLSQEQLRQCLYSIGDNAAFLRVNRDPCEKMIFQLKEFFDPSDAKVGRSLAIHSGQGGARLSHNHSRQYSYVIQSLTLWKEILQDMFRLWTLAEQDLLSTTARYRLTDTGQGLNRVQPAPKTLRAMHVILSNAQQNIGSWVGSSVVHMGDHNVPNSLVFVDKYSQIYRILLPICNTLSQIPKLMEVPSLKAYITKEFGSERDLQIEILSDFFRHAFDGSGADNFYDAGSCVDGRLTSAWNWCASIEKKRYFSIFLLTGFSGFDGAW
ncbi:hypothetical protein SISSUDRAFT_1040890 [Sistotremastrum suecicum HHB10207 ss-3]|uniref:B box-type domain-containing protein n=1 Tax=Sistotremastrum suecicum HHB10207 ss-3 TaxID=1314776 RepID=A0A166HR55_9AGAM|nr:hypothetical protein SISSUDRAFT_1040890 [Sistotremastrum suecicum HHB10207 ss-3]